MDATGHGRSELDRIGFLLRRDGYAATRAWVERTAAIYREQLRRCSGAAADSVYCRRYSRAVAELEEWLAANRPNQH